MPVTVSPPSVQDIFPCTGAHEPRRWRVAAAGSGCHRRYISPTMLRYATSPRLPIISHTPATIKTFSAIVEKRNRGKINGPRLRPRSRIALTPTVCLGKLASVNLNHLRRLTAKVAQLESTRLVASLESLDIEIKSTHTRQIDYRCVILA